ELFLPGKRLVLAFPIANLGEQRSSAVESNGWRLRQRWVERVSAALVGEQRCSLNQRLNQPGLLLGSGILQITRDHDHLSGASTCRQRNRSEPFVAERKHPSTCRCRPGDDRPLRQRSAELS